MRKNPLANDNYYHVLNRSIAKFTIFNDEQDFNRLIEIINLYRYPEFSYKYSAFLKLSPIIQDAIIKQVTKTKPLVDVIAFCIMPTHPHLFLKQLQEKGISLYMSRVLNSYTKYFNAKYKRKGPLWEGRFKSVLVESDRQCLHLTRYIHLNPVSANLIERPEDWLYSSYLEHIDKKKDGFCRFDNLFDITPIKYEKFVDDRIGYQKNLSKIKHLLLEDYSG